jgi:hypothetical protein
VDLDDVPDGGNYERLLAAQVTSGVYINATTTTKGIASFAEDDFTVSSGAVSLDELDTTDFNITNLTTFVENHSTGGGSADFTDIENRVTAGMNVFITATDDSTIQIHAIVPQVSEDDMRDAAGAMITEGSHTNVTAVYHSDTRRLDLAASAAGTTIKHLAALYPRDAIVADGHGFIGTGATLVGGYMLLFDAGTAEDALFQFHMPEYYDGDTIAVTLKYSMASGTANEVEWLVKAMAVGDGDGDPDAASFSGQTSMVVTVPGTVGMDYVTGYITNANFDNVAAGDDVWLHVTTDATDAVNDDATGDRELRGIVVEMK